MSDVPPPPPPGGGGGSPPPPPPPPPGEFPPPPPPPGGPHPLRPPPPPSGAPAPATPQPVAAPDPHHLGAAAAHLSSAGRKQGRVALGIASVSLDEGEVVDSVLQGEINDAPGVGVLTDRRLLLVNEAAWVPLVESIPLPAPLTVEGEAEGRTASVAISAADGVRRINHSRDVELAKDFAVRLRSRATPT